MTSTPQGPLDEPVDSSGAAAPGQDTPGGAPVSGSPAEADSDVGYSRGDEGESVEQAAHAGGDTTDADYLDRDTVTGRLDDSGNL